MRRKQPRFPFQKVSCVDLLEFDEKAFRAPLNRTVLYRVDSIQARSAAWVQTLGY
jgi:hypothetical protein